MRFSAHLKPNVAVLAADQLVRNTPLVRTHFIKTMTDEALRRIDGVLGIGDSLALRHGTHKNLALVVPSHNGGSRPSAFVIDDDLGFLAVHHRNYAVRRSQVDSDDLSHLSFSDDLSGLYWRFFAEVWLRRRR